MITQARIIAFWQYFYRGWDTAMIAGHFECREFQVYNALGSTRGTELHARAKALSQSDAQ